MGFRFREISYLSFSQVGGLEDIFLLTLHQVLLHNCTIEIFDDYNRPIEGTNARRLRTATLVQHEMERNASRKYYQCNKILFPYRRIMHNHIPKLTFNKIETGKCSRGSVSKQGHYLY